jgi:hypothetical protein
MSRRLVELRAVRAYEWTVRPLAWGLDAISGEHIGFAVSTRSAGTLQEILETERPPIVEVDEIDVLFVRPAAGAPEGAPTA